MSDRKNIALLLVQPAVAPAGEIDPVCGMTVDPQRAASTYGHAGQTYYFCNPSSLCRRQRAFLSHLLINLCFAAFAFAVAAFVVRPVGLSLARRTSDEARGERTQMVE